MTAVSGASASERADDGGDFGTSRPPWHEEIMCFAAGRRRNKKPEEVEKAIDDEDAGGGRDRRLGWRMPVASRYGHAVVEELPPISGVVLQHTWRRLGRARQAHP